MGRKIPPIILESLETYLDAPMAAENFRRGNKSDTYWRRTSDGKQYVFIIPIKQYPGYDFTIFRVRFGLEFPEVKKKAIEMAGNDEYLLFILGAKDRYKIIYADDIRTMLEKPKPWPKWEAETYDEVPSVIKDISEFIQQYLLDFLNETKTIKEYLSVYERKDPRLQVKNQYHFIVYIAAAYLLVGEPEKALRTLDEEITATAMRKKFSPVFEYVKRELEKS